MVKFSSQHHHHHYNLPIQQVVKSTTSSSSMIPYIIQSNDIKEEPRLNTPPPLPSSPARSVSSPSSSSMTSRTIHIDKEQIEKYFSLPQPSAAKKLGVSLSTLKRRFYETHGGTRWPYCGIKKAMKKRTVKYILNTKNKPTKLLDPHTIHTLALAFKGQFSPKKVTK
jgi:hypothetical protein